MTLPLKLPQMSLLPSDVDGDGFGEIALAKAVREKLTAEEVVPQEIKRSTVEIHAAAEAQQTYIRAQGEADAILAKYNAEAEGIRKLLASKAEGYNAG